MPPILSFHEAFNLSLLDVVSNAVGVPRPHDVDQLVEVLGVECLSGVLHDGIEHGLIDGRGVSTVVLKEVKLL